MIFVSAGLLTLDRQAVSSSVSAHLYQVRMTKLGHVVPHVFDEQLLFESPGIVCGVRLFLERNVVQMPSVCSLPVLSCQDV